MTQTVESGFAGIRRGGFQVAAKPELDLKVARETVKVVTKRVQLGCEHISVKQLASVPARRICQS
jgi:hypothetical protein